MPHGLGRCPNLAEQNALLAGEMDERARNSFSRHLQACTPCRRALVQLADDDARKSQLAILLHGEGGPRSELSEQASDGAADATPATGSIYEVLEKIFGNDVNPGIDLDVKEAADSGFSDVVLSKLTNREGAFRRYRLKDEVARGGMGAILRVWDEDLQRHLAMKVMLGEGLQTSEKGGGGIDTQSLARFLEEAQVTSQLDHPGIVPVHELGLDDHGRVFFTMKLVKGKTLKQVFQEFRRGEGAWSHPRIVGLLLRVCEALAYAHDKGVLHRDLKPANIMVGKFGEVYVMDWGVAKVLGREDSHDMRIQADPEVASTVVHSVRDSHDAVASGTQLYTMDGDIVGTPAYMPPEQAAGRLSEITVASDVYALGAILYHFLAGHMPYVPPGARVHNYALWQRVQEGPPRALREIATDVPAELVAICEKAMARHPSERYANVPALAEDLSAYLDGRVVHAYEAGTWAEGKKWLGRNRSLATMMGLALFLTLAGLIGATNVQARERKRAEADARRATLEADAGRLSLMGAELDTLWPPYRDRVPALELWLADARRLQADLPKHEASLEELLQDELRGTPENERRAHVLSTLLAGRPALESWLAPSGILEGHGWSAERRLTFARGLEHGFAEDGAHRRAWEDAREGIAARYPDLDLQPQRGLIPIGQDPRSTLFEFAVLATGEPPARDENGELMLTPASSIVLILVPGGSYLMGAQSQDPSKPNYDRHASVTESPPHRVRLAAYFLSKYELTQGQWLHMTGTRPSEFGLESKTAWNPAWLFPDGPPSLLHPVESLTWRVAAETMARFGLALPSEAQWEYAAQDPEGSSGPGSDAEQALDRIANVADRMWKDHHGVGFDPRDELLNDGCAVHAPVGRYLPNARGFHDMLGNVYEWCQDTFTNKPYDAESGANAREGMTPQQDPVASDASAPYRAFRGGSFAYPSVFARPSARMGFQETTSDPSFGVRPARLIDPR